MIERERSRLEQLIYSRGRNAFRKYGLTNSEQIKFALETRQAEEIMAMSGLGLKTYLWWCNYLGVEPKSPPPPANLRKTHTCPSCAATLNVIGGELRVKE